MKFKQHVANVSPGVRTPGGIDWKREKWADSIGSKYIKFGEKCTVKFADEIIVLSENVQEYFLDVYGRETVFVPNGVNRPTIREPDEIKRRWDLEKDGYILFLGRLVPEKGLRYLVKAYKGLNGELAGSGGVGKKLVIAGGGSDADAFAREMEESCRNMEDRVIFTGFIHGKILDELYSNAYLYVLPSDLEGMPLSLLEAMSYGNCCVVSDIEECVSVVEDKAVAFRKGDAEDLKEKLKALLDDPALVQKYKDASADFICGKYSWDDAVKRI